MQRRYSIFWLSTFVVLLMLNIVIILGSAREAVQEEILTEDDALLEAYDEASLAWWPEITEDENIPNLDEVGNAIYVPANHAPPISIDSRAKTRDYIKLMAKYRQKLKRYLILYFHVTPMFAGSEEE